MTYFVKKWAVRDWRVVAKPRYSTIGTTVSRHTTKGGALAALRRIEGVKP